MSQRTLALLLAVALPLSVSACSDDEPADTGVGETVSDGDSSGEAALGDLTRAEKPNDDISCAALNEERVTAATGVEGLQRTDPDAEFPVTIGEKIEWTDGSPTTVIQFCEFSQPPTPEGDVSFNNVTLVVKKAERDVDVQADANAAIDEAMKDPVLKEDIETQNEVTKTKMFQVGGPYRGVGRTFIDARPDAPTAYIGGLSSGAGPYIVELSVVSEKEVSEQQVRDLHTVVMGELE